LSVAEDLDQNGARVVRVSRAEAIAVAGGLYQPIRRQIGVHGFGINAYFASKAGDQLIEVHDETGSGSGGHAELYLVIAGRARFVVAQSEIDAPQGTIVYVPDPASRREASAVEDDTAAIVVGCPAEQEIPNSPFEFWFVAQQPYNDGDYDAAIAIVAEGLERWPEHPDLLYQMACYHALAGRPEQALDYLERACTQSTDVADWTRGDPGPRLGT